MATSLFFLLLLTTAAALLTFAATSTALGFNCTATTTTKCQALVGFIPQNTTSLSSLARKFNLSSFTDLIGPNSLPLSSTSKTKLPANVAVRIPIPCLCANGTGVSDHTPVHTVSAGEFLSMISDKEFSGLLDYQAIATANQIPDPNKILVGQKLWIPLPCSCDQVGSGLYSVEHYAHIVAKGSGLDSVAAQFGTTEEMLMRVNGISDPKTLQAGAVLDVPLRVCSSSIQATSLDSSLAVTNGTYAITANGCVQCKCNTSWTLDCQTSPVPKCGPVKCNATNLDLGNSTVLSSCELTRCSYAGYDNTTIFATMTTESTCPAPAPAPSKNSGGSRHIRKQMMVHLSFVMFTVLFANMFL